MRVALAGLADARHHQLREAFARFGIHINLAHHLGAPLGHIPFEHQQPQVFNRPDIAVNGVARDTRSRSHRPGRERFARLVFENLFRRIHEPGYHHFPMLADRWCRNLWHISSQRRPLLLRTQSMSATV